ncbi:MAG TPA: glycosyltransferase 87 family protein [Usitatibacter sp.]
MKRGIAAALLMVLATALLAAAAYRAWYDFDHYYGVDYYQFWGVPVAHEIVGGNPYARIPQYAEALNHLADSSTDPHLRWSNHFRREIQPAATPFFYAASALLPRAFDDGYAAWIAVSFAVLIASLYWMARKQGAGTWAALAIAAGISLTFAPFDNNMKAGNVAALQLGFIVAAIAFARWRVETSQGMLAGAYFAAIALFVIWKPNTAFLAVFLAAQLFLTRQRRVSMIAAGGAVAGTAAAIAIGAGYFDGLRGWSDWSAYVNGQQGLLIYRTEEGNISIGMLMSQRLGGLGPVGYSLLLAAAMLALLVGRSRLRATTTADSSNARGSCSKIHGSRRPWGSWSR